MNISELEIIKAALEGDIIRQKEHENAELPQFKAWLSATEKVHKKVSNELITRKARERILERWNK